MSQFNQKMNVRRFREVKETNKMHSLQRAFSTSATTHFEADKPIWQAGYDSSQFIIHKPEILKRFLAEGVYDDFIDPTNQELIPIGTNDYEVQEYEFNEEKVNPEEEADRLANIRLELATAARRNGYLRYDVVLPEDDVPEGDAAQIDVPGRNAGRRGGRGGGRGGRGAAAENVLSDDQRRGIAQVDEEYYRQLGKIEVDKHRKITELKAENHAIDGRHNTYKKMKAKTIKVLTSTFAKHSLGDLEDLILRSKFRTLWHKLEAKYSRRDGGRQARAHSLRTLLMNWIYDVKKPFEFNVFTINSNCRDLETVEERPVAPAQKAYYFLEGIKRSDAHSGIKKVAESADYEFGADEDNPEIWNLVQQKISRKLGVLEAEGKIINKFAPGADANTAHESAMVTNHNSNKRKGDHSDQQYANKISGRGSYSGRSNSHGKYNGGERGNRGGRGGQHQISDSCVHCSSKEHKSAYCPTLGIPCEHCSKTNHKKDNCWIQKAKAKTSSNEPVSVANKLTNFNSTTK